jgi:hypothetical protein
LFFHLLRPSILIDLTLSKTIWLPHHRGYSSSSFSSPQVGSPDISQLDPARRPHLTHASSKSSALSEFDLPRPELLYCKFAASRPVSHVLLASLRQLFRFLMADPKIHSVSGRSIGFYNML